jgi:uncharacterized membrane protein
MTDKKGTFELLGMCAALVVLSLLGIVSAFVTHVFDSLDGLLLLAVCLMMAGIFTLMILWFLKDAGWLPRRSSASGDNPAVHGK